MRAYSSVLLLFCLSGARAESLVITPSTISITVEVDSLVLPSLKLRITSDSQNETAFDFRGQSFSSSPITPVKPFLVPLSGVTPADVQVDLDTRELAQLRPATYAYNLYFSPIASPTNITVVRVDLILPAPPPPTVTSVVNAASLESSAISPVEIVTIYGDHLSQPYGYGISLVPLDPQSQNYGFPLTTGRTTVTLNGIRAPLLYSGLHQINAVVPAGIADASTAELIVIRDSQDSTPLRLPVVPAAPGILSFSQNGVGQGVVMNPDYSVADTNHPAPPGSYVSIFATGCGLLSRGFLDGQLIRVGPYPETTVPVAVTIGGKPARVTYSGAAPTYVYGLIQINAIVPVDVAPGVQPVVLTVAGSSSRQDLTMVVR